MSVFHTFFATILLIKLKGFWLLIAQNNFLLSETVEEDERQQLGIIS